MSAVNDEPKPSLRFPVAIGIVLAAALLLWAALTRDGPDFALDPLMAELPVQVDGKSMHVMKYEVTIAEWDRCHQDGGCALQLRARPNQDPAETPATGLSYVDVRDYVTWINAKTGGGFRLPTLAEWEHMAASVLPDEPDPIFIDPNLTWASSYLLEEQQSRALRERGAFSTTAEGISDLDGSVWEWTMDCYAGSGATDPNRCPAFFVAGEHIAAMSFLVRDPARGGCAVGSPPAHLGMRLVKDAT